MRCTARWRGAAAASSNASLHCLSQMSASFARTASGLASSGKRAHREEQPGPQYFAVTRGPENAREPVQFSRQLVGPFFVEQRFEASQRAAQSPGSDAHLVHRVVETAPNRDVVTHENPGVAAQSRPRPDR